MGSRLTIPEYAKRAARQALELRDSLPKSRRFGLTTYEARREGVFSGVERAKQIISSPSLPPADAQSVASFYQRFKGCRTKKCEGAIGLWGGRKFGKKAVEFVKNL